MNASNGANRYKPTGFIVFAAIIAAIILMVTSSTYRRPCTIHVGGQPVASVASNQAAMRVLSMARKNALGTCKNLNVRFDKPVTISPAPKNTGITPIPEALKAIEESADVEVQAYAVVADDAAVVALTSKADAEKSLDMLKKYYESKVKGKSSTSFKGNVYVDCRYVPSDILRETAEDALAIMTSISKPAVYHVIQSGDRAVNLSAQYAISMQDMKKLNPEVNLEKLVEGTHLLIHHAQLPIVVVSKVETTKTTTVNAPAESVRAGISTGKRTARLVVTYENGMPVSEEIVSQLTTWERPKTPQIQTDDGRYRDNSSRRYRRHSKYSRYSRTGRN